ncbi:hypothetical protein BJV78DRAFT_908543 [Lactifluus subvellereus]|nr:hypothetical protein BJV78DRAFT_908543 [Lactifluus subvellereus]
MSLQTFGKGALRVAKNYTKGYSDVQAKVREATSNDPWGPSGTQMNEIAQMTYNQNDFVEIMEMLDKRLNDKGKNWRHVFKCLTVLDYLLHAGSENVVVYFRDNIYIIKTLKEFQYIDEYGKDQGANVRQKAKDITNLLMDETRLRQERRSRANMRDRMLGQAGDDDDNNDEPQVPRGDENNARRTRAGGDDDLRRAIEESKRLAEERSEDADLARAIKLSEEEEEARRKAALADSGSLFDDQNNNLIDLQGQNNGLQPQFTMQPQFTSFNPYQQQAQQEAMQAEWARQQQEWVMQQQQQQQQQLQLQAQQEEWMRQQLAQQQAAQQQALLSQQQQQQQQQEFLVAQAQQQARLVPQATAFGSNNPFAAAASPASSAASPQPPVQSLSNFSLPSTYESHEPPPRRDYTPESQSAPAPSPQSTPKRGQTRADQEHAHLANLFAARDGDGVDTFGNVGSLRFGQTEYGKLVAQKTGAAPQSGFNPFSQQQQQGQNSEQPFFTI